MRKCKSNHLLFFAITATLLLISTSTVVAQVQSEPAIHILKNNLNDLRQLLSRSKDLKGLMKAELKKILESINPKVALDRLLHSFSYILTNETFIQYMRSPEVQSLLASKAYALYYKSTPTQKILHSQEFLNFCNSEACQQFQTRLSLSSTQGLRQNLSTHKNAQDQPTLAQILLFIITWFICGIVLWIPAVLILYAAVWPMGTMWVVIGLVVHNMDELAIFVPFIMFIICTLLSIVWPIFAIWLVYMELKWYGLFPTIPWLPWITTE